MTVYLICNYFSPCSTSNKKYGINQCLTMNLMIHIQFYVVCNLTLWPWRKLSGVLTWIHQHHKNIWLLLIHVNTTPQLKNRQSLHLPNPISCQQQQQHPPGMMNCLRWRNKLFVLITFVTLVVITNSRTGTLISCCCCFNDSSYWNHAVLDCLWSYAVTIHNHMSIKTRHCVISLI